MRIPYLCVFFLCATLPACGGSTSVPAGIVDEGPVIRHLLEAQVEAWNRGDIEAFMQGYLHSDSLRFASGGTVRYGWDSTLARYRRTYPDRSAMGSLEFTGIRIDMIGVYDALAFGRWHLTRSDGYDDVGGLFTLLLRRTQEGWRIVADHTSSADAS